MHAEMSSVLSLLSCKIGQDLFDKTVFFTVLKTEKPRKFLICMA